MVKRPDRPPDYDRDAGLVQRRVFADRAVHSAELASMFDRAWLFVGPANWLARSSDFVTSRMGDQPVVAWRGTDGELRVFVNRCPRSDEALTLQARGRASALRCPCHGSAYAAEGAGGGLPALEQIVHVAIHRGLVFGNRDPDAVPFDTWLGEFGWYLDLFLPGGSVEAHGDDSLRWIIEANWKLPVLAGCGDFAENSADRDEAAGGDGAQISCTAGAVAVRKADHGASDDPRDGFAPLGAVLFPNLLFDSERHSLDIVHPVGPTRCEVHSYCMIDAGASVADREAVRRRFQFLSGPAGIKSGYQARLWEAVTAGARSGRHRDQALSLRMGLGQEQLSNLPGSFAPLVSEANQRAFFDWWQKQLSVPARNAPRLMRIW